MSEFCYRHADGRGDTASDTSLIEPANKKWLMELDEERRLKREENWGSKNDDDELPR